MGIEEPLQRAGLREDFERAARRRDRALMEGILMRAGFSRYRAAWEADIVVENSYAGKTVAQRLDEAGLLNEYRDVARARDRAGMVRLLMQVGLREDRAGWEADAELHKYDGMTINERLWEAGLHEEFGQAARARNRVAMIRVLVQVGLSEAQAAGTTDATLANPEKYGY